MNGDERERGANGFAYLKRQFYAITFVANIKDIWEWIADDFDGIEIRYCKGLNLQSDPHEIVPICIAQCNMKYVKFYLKMFIEF
jgi:hypothetical protein